MNSDKQFTAVEFGAHRVSVPKGAIMTVLG